MAYLTFKSMHPVNEDTKTVLHNIWTRLLVGLDPHALNLKNWGILLTLLTVGGSIAVGGTATIYLPHEFIRVLNNIFGLTDKIDEAYFDSMYHIDDRLNDKLAKACKDIPGALLLDERENKIKSNAFFDLGNKGLGSQHVRKATRGIGRGLIIQLHVLKRYFIKISSI